MNEVVTLSRDVEINDIRSLICELRGQAVMLDRDLAAIYRVMTGRLNEAVKRNLVRFPSEFMFQLSETEMMKHSPYRLWNCGLSKARRTKETTRRNPIDRYR